VAIAALCGIAAVVVPAFAQVSILSRTGPTIHTFQATAGGSSTDVAYDPQHGVYFAVADGTGHVWGSFLDPQGNVIGAAVQIDSNLSPSQSHRVIVVYSPHVSDGAGGSGGFLVVWTQNFQQTPAIISRVVAYPGTLVGPETPLPGAGNVDVAYSPISRIFMAVVRTPDRVSVLRIGLDGQPLGSPAPISGTLSSSQFASIVWNSVLDEFGIFFDVGAFEGSFTRITPGGTIARDTDLVLGILAADGNVAFNPNTSNYLLVWSEGTAPPFAPQPGLYGSEITGAGEVLATGMVAVITSRGFGLSLSFSPVTGTFLVASSTFSLSSRVVELNGHGAPISRLSDVMGFPARALRAASRLDVGGWLVVAATNFTPNSFKPSFTMAQPLITNSADGGSDWTLASSVCPDIGFQSEVSSLQCINGTWVFPAATPLVAPPPAPMPSTNSCVTPDPFITIGGGRCSSGNWYPPGMTIPSTPPPTPPPTEPTTPAPDTCSIPDPFVSLGGGTCVNSNWYPPGMRPPDMTPPKPPPPVSCPGTDPFLGLAGLAGVCINGDWIPVALIANAGATVIFHAEWSGFWALHLDDGRVFVPMGGLPPSFQSNGLRVTITGKVRADLGSIPGVMIEVLSIS
jgi:hypothetical protein